MLTSKYYIYTQSPLDSWFWIMPIEEYFQKNVAEITLNPDVDKSFKSVVSELNSLKDFIDFRNWCLEQIKTNLWWNEDIPKIEWLFFVPSEITPLIWYIMKQDNNWTTFVVSPVPPADPKITDW